MFKHTIMFAALTGLVLALTSTAQAALSSQLGILDLDANGGINPGTGNPWAAGDTYHLAFLTSTRRNATSPDIADYNAHVQAAANATTVYDIGVDEGGIWKAIASARTTAGVSTSAVTNTGTAWTNQDPGFPIFRLDSVNVATSYRHLWSTETEANLAALITLTETGGEITQSGQNIWTGSGATGNARDPLGPYGFVGIGRINFGGGNIFWIHANTNQAPNGGSLRFYALSQPLTVGGVVIPEPSTFLLAALGLLGLLGFTRRRRK